MKEKIKEKLDEQKIWWRQNKDKVVKLGLAGGALFLLGELHATNKIMNHDRVLISDSPETTQNEQKEFSFVEF